MITEFQGEFRFLSNFFIEPDGSTVEHEFQATKTTVPSLKVMIMQARTPGEAKRMGRKLTELRDDWEFIKLEVMEVLVRKKFLDWPELMVQLADTDHERLVEGNHWHDNFWGICSCERCQRFKGRNHLGKILMKVRGI